MGLLYIKYLHYIFIKLQPFLIITHGFLENHLFFGRFSQLSTSILFGEFPTSHVYLKILICSLIFYYIRKLLLKKRISTTIEPPFIMNYQPICHMPLSELRGADLDPPANPSAIFFCPPDLPHRCLRSFDHSLTGWGPTVISWFTNPYNPH